MKYLVISEDGTAFLQTAVSQEDLSGFYQSTIMSIFRFNDPLTSGQVVVEELKSVDQEDADDDTPEDEQVDGQVFTPEWREVPFGS